MGATAAVRFCVLGPLQVNGPDGALPISGPARVAGLAAALAALDETRRSSVVAEARRTGLDAVVAAELERARTGP